MSHGRFSEETLYEDICSVWGAHGAHAYMCRWLITEIDKLKAEVFARQREIDELKRGT